MRSTKVCIEYVKEEYAEAWVSSEEILQMIADEWIYGTKKARLLHFAQVQLDNKTEYHLTRAGELHMSDIVWHYCEEADAHGTANAHFQYVAALALKTEGIYHDFL